MATKKFNRELNKQELMEKIKSAKNEVCILGAIAFDLDWEYLLGSESDKNGLKWKFFNNSNFTLRILCESENLIAQYTLLSQGDDRLLKGTLESVKGKILGVLKRELSRYAESNMHSMVGIEPPEDVFKKDLNMLSDKIIRSELIDLICKNKDWEEQLLNNVYSEIKKFFKEQTDAIAKVITEKGGWNVAFEMMPKVVAFFADYESKIKTQLISAKQLIDLEFAFGDVNKVIVYSFNINGKDQVFKCSKTLRDIFQHAIYRFKFIGNNADDFNNSFESRRQSAEKEAAYAVDKKRTELETTPDKAQRLFIKNCYMPIPVPLIKIDNELFITHALTQFNSIDKFQYVGCIDSPEWSTNENVPYRSYWISEFQKYYRLYFDTSIKNGVQKYSTEETLKGDRKEVIDIFNEYRVRIGTGPRDAFLSNLAIVKSVVWALIFDRKGNVLLHQRSLNAKDNRGLWDKSVGGHVSVSDLDTIEAFRREVTEELYTLEAEGQGHKDESEWMKINKQKIIYLGEWDIERYPDFNGLHLKTDEYYAFTLNYSNKKREERDKDFRTEIITTKRLLPSGKSVEAKCFVDAYLCVVSEDFDITSLQNSKYLMINPTALKKCVESKKITINPETRYYDASGIQMDFNVTSDLYELVNNTAIWDDVVAVFSESVKNCFKK